MKRIFRSCIVMLLLLLLGRHPLSAQNIITPAYDVNRVVYVANAIDRTEMFQTPERIAMAVFVVKLYSLDNDLYCPNPSPNHDPNFPSGMALRLMAQAQDKYNRLYKSGQGSRKFVMQPYDVTSAMLGLLAEQPGNPVANTLAIEALNFQTCVGYRVSDDPSRPAYLQQSNYLGGSRVAGGINQYQSRFFEKMFDLARQNSRVASVVDAFFGPLFKGSVLDNTFTLLSKNRALRDSQNFAPFVSLIQPDGRIITTAAQFTSLGVAFNDRMNSVTTTAMNTLATVTPYQTGNYAAYYLTPNPNVQAALTVMDNVITPKLQGARAAAYALPFTIARDPRWVRYEATVKGLEMGAEIAFIGAALSKVVNILNPGDIASIPYEVAAHTMLLSARTMDFAACFGAFGSSDFEVIIDGVNRLSAQLHSIQQQINGRFDIIDTKLDTIYTTMNAQFNAVKSYLVNINATLTEVQNQVRAMQLQINTVQSDIYRLSQFIYNFANESLRVSSGLISSLDEIDTISRNGTNIDLSHYSGLYGVVKSYALVNSKAAAEVSDWNSGNRSYTDLALITELSQGAFPEWNLNYMLQFARQKWGLTLGPSSGIANPRAWAMASTGMMRLAAAKPSFFAQTTVNDSVNNNDGFYGARSVGLAIQQAVADCALRFNPTTSQYEKSLLFRRLMDFQQQKATALMIAITNVENAAGGTLQNKISAVRTQWNAVTPTAEGAVLQNAIKEFDGARRLLDKFVEFALSRSLAGNEFLSGFLYSPQRLPDALLVNNPAEANPATAKSLYGKYNGTGVNPKDTFQSLQNQRWTATDTLIQSILDFIVANTTRENPVGEPLAEVDNLLQRFGYFTLSRVGGRVRPKPGQGQFIPGEPIYITFRSRTNSRPPLTLTTTLDANSEFTLAVPADFYDVLIRTAKYLQKARYGVDLRNGSVPASTRVIDLQLTVGEVYFDNRIDSRDLTALRNAWLSTSVSPLWNPLSDLNSDGVVNALDLSLLMSPGVWGEYGDL